ncbi:MAG: HK97 gp10 family phage protein [Perlabentimonas sp.]
MSNLNLKIPKSEQRKFERELEKFAKKNKKEFAHRVEQSTYATQKMAQRNAPVDQGDLRQKIESKVSDMTGEVVSKANYSAAVEYGTKPHKIRVKNKKVLASNAKGKWNFYGKEVDHPGTQGQPFLFPAWNKAQKDLLKGLRKVFK